MRVEARISKQIIGLSDCACLFVQLMSSPVWFCVDEAKFININAKRLLFSIYYFKGVTLK